MYDLTSGEAVRTEGNASGGGEEVDATGELIVGQCSLLFGVNGAEGG